LGTGIARDGSFDRPDGEDFAGPNLAHLAVAAFFSRSILEFMISNIATHAGTVEGGEISGDSVADAVGAGGFSGGAFVAILDGESAVFAGVLSIGEARNRSENYHRESSESNCQFIEFHCGHVCFTLTFKLELSFARCTRSTSFQLIYICVHFLHKNLYTFSIYHTTL
jgi:hypothetical protein